MILLYPYFLLLALFIFLIWGILKYQKAKKSIISLEVREKLAVSGGNNFHHYREWFFIAALTCMVLALSRPIILMEAKEGLQSSQMGYLAISLDVSKSMLATDVYPNRLLFSKVAIEQMITRFDNFQIALNAFSRDGFLVAPFSEDKATLEFFLKHLNQNSMTSEGSSILSALSCAKKSYESFPQIKRDILIVTDGADGQEVDEAIELAQKENLRVHLYLVGTTNGSTIKDESGEILKDNQGNIVITKRNDDLEKLSRTTGGVYVATSGDSLDIAWLCEQIALKVQKNEVQKNSYDNARELFYYPLFLAVVLLFLALNALHVKKIIVPLLLVLNVQNLHSGILDFWTIHKAEESYGEKAYSQSSEYFSRLAEIKKSDALNYDLANSLYQEKKYDKALALYQNIATKDALLEQKRLHNLGNTLAQMNKKNDAIKVYEEALKIKEDADTRYNLELLKKQKEQDKKSDNKEEEKSKDQNQTKQDKDKEQSTKNQPSNKEDKKQEQKEAKKEEDTQKKMSEQEAKKWEKMLNNTAPATKPTQIFKGEVMEKKNAITW